MDKNFLDYTGLKKYTLNLKKFILEKIAGFVPTSRTINDKPLTSDIVLNAKDIGVETPDLSGYVPTSRTVNGKALTSDITLSASDVSARPSSWTPTAAQVGAVPTSRTVNGKALSSNITLTAEDIGVETPDLSTYAPKASPVFTGSISLGRKSGTTVGSNSFAVGYQAEASGSHSHAEGNKTEASGSDSHAEGNGAIASNVGAHAEGLGTTASGGYTHAEGYKTTASTVASHAEGRQTTANGDSSHAEGGSTTASGAHSHAEGNNTIASGDMSHAEGLTTTASNIASHAQGKCNKVMSDGGLLINTVGDAFVVGNGLGVSSLSNALRLAYEGTLYLTKAYNSTGADYAEYFEWLDGNPMGEDRVGRFVTLEGDKIKVAGPGDYILGVVSGQPCIIGNGDEDWLGRWEHDDFNRFVKEYLVHNEVEVTPSEDVLNAENSDEALNAWMLINDIQERDGHYFKMETEVVDYPTASWRHKANPAYDPSQPYVERKDRQEWDAIGMVGVLSVLDDGTCLPNSYCKVSSNGIATSSNNKIDAYRVIARVTPDIIKIIMK